MNRSNQLTIPQSHSQGHSLAALLTNLQQIFSAHPPVYARPPTPAGSSARPPQAQPQHLTTAYNQPPPPPERPAALNPSRQQSIDQLPVYQPTGTVLGHPPPLAVHIPQPRPLHPPSSQGTALAFAIPTPNGGPPPVPPSPLRTHARQSSLPFAVPNGQSSAPCPGSPLRPAPNGNPPIGQQWGYDPSRVAGPSHYSHQSQEGNMPVRPAPPGAVYGAMTPHVAPVNGHLSQPLTHHLQQFSPPAPQRQQSAAPVLQPRTAPKPPIPDLLSSDEEGDALQGARSASTPLPSHSIPGQGESHTPARPLPPTTLHLHSLLASHLKTRLPHLIAHLGSQTTQLESVRTDLETGSPAIRDEMARLEAVREVCEGVVNRVGAVVSAGEKRCEELQARGEVSVDEVVCSISIVHNQLIDLVAEDNAIEDTVYHLTRALDAERLDLDRFLKQIRILGREQYQKRALIEKITMELRGR
ncbi:hypothetical protein QFC21_004812 [Naganishia friedmannii]|uniref:Uncharacterized protein n=1 Tax=Naganishia friedmannii TaxID=89922 RepID=A0ACC2VDJ3_9TREE|nr:hypothetical protein QFC21_004812 [Naganishia friedmannii]